MGAAETEKTARNVRRHSGQACARAASRWRRPVAHQVPQQGRGQRVGFSKAGGCCAFADGERGCDFRHIGHSDVVRVGRMLPSCSRYRPACPISRGGLGAPVQRGGKKWDHPTRRVFGR